MVTPSVQLYSIRDAIAEDAGQALQRLADIGFRSVEPFDIVSRTEAYADAFGRTGLHAPSGHGSLAFVDDLNPVFDAAETLGIQTVIESAVRDGWDDADAVSRLADSLNAAASAAAERELRIGYHNHWWEFENLDGVPALEYLAQRLDPAVALEVDVYWATVAGADVPDLLGRLGERVQFLHLKDGILAGGVEAQLPAGRGEVDLDAAIAVAPDAVRIIEFDAYEGDVFDGIAKSFAHLSAREDSE